MSTVDSSITRLYTEQYSVRNKQSGQLLGYARLLPKALTDEGIELVPWLDGANNNYCNSSSIQDRGMPTLVCSDDMPALNNSTERVSSNGNSLSLSSQLGTETEIPKKQVDFNASISLTQVLTSTPENRRPLQIAVSQSVEPDLTPPHCPKLEEHAAATLDGKVSAGKRKKYIDESSNSSDNSMTKVAKRNEVPDNLKENDNCKPIRKYNVFMEFVDDSKRNKNRQYWKVKCKLCGDGRVHSYGNIRRHIESLHESSVVCEICNNEFSQKRCLAEHKRRVHSQVSMRGDSKDTLSKVDKGMKELQGVTPVPPPANLIMKKSSTFHQDSQITFIKPSSKYKIGSHQSRVKSQDSYSNNNAKFSNPLNIELATHASVKRAGMCSSMKSKNQGKHNFDPPKSCTMETVESTIVTSPKCTVSSPVSLTGTGVSLAQSNSVSNTTAVSVPSGIMSAFVHGTSDVSMPLETVVTSSSGFVLSPDADSIPTKTKVNASSGTGTTVIPARGTVIVTSVSKETSDYLPDIVVTTSSDTVVTPLPEISQASACLSSETLVTARDECTTVLRDNMVPVTMVSNTKGKKITMGLLKDLKIKKAMRRFANKHNVDYKCLKFELASSKTELTGDELVGNLEETNIIVYGDLLAI